MRADEAAAEAAATSHRLLGHLLPARRRRKQERVVFLRRRACPDKPSVRLLHVAARGEEHQQDYYGHYCWPAYDAVRHPGGWRLGLRLCWRRSMRH